VALPLEVAISRLRLRLVTVSGGGPGLDSRDANHHDANDDRDNATAYVFSVCKALFAALVTK
jgi:hypothetical protein